MLEFTPPQETFKTTDQLIMWAVKQRMKVNQALDQLNKTKANPTQQDYNQLKQARYQVNKMILNAADDMINNNEHGFHTVREIRDFMFGVKKEVAQIEKELYSQ